MRTFTLLCLLSALFALEVNAQTTVVIESDRDNTLYESTGGTLSNGAGEYMFAGRTNQIINNLRRAVMHFPLSSIPAGATITSVTLDLQCSQTNGTTGPKDISVYRVTSDWGEGTSVAGGQQGGGGPSTTNDATWVHSFFSGTNWGTVGGDFNATPRATTTVNLIGPYAWTSASLAADVQDWLDNGSNFGWMLRGPETGTKSAKRFNTHEFLTAAQRPRLSVTYTMPSPCTAPTNFSSSITFTTATLNWSAVAAAQAYEIQGGVLGASPIVLVVGSAITSFAASGLNPNTTYVWRVRALCDTATSSPYSGVDTFMTPACPAPIPTATINITPTTADLTWTPVGGAAGYRVQGRRIPGGSVVTLDLAGGALSMFSASGLIPMTNYEWAVSTFCTASVLSPASPSEFFTTLGVPQKTSITGSDLEFEIYPNPASDQVTVVLPQGHEGTVQIEVFDVLGNRVMLSNHEATTTQAILDLSDLSSGTYFVQMQSGDTRIARRLAIR